MSVHSPRTWTSKLAETWFNIQCVRRKRPKGWSKRLSQDSKDAYFHERIQQCLNAFEIASGTKESVKIYDLSKVADNVRALRRGIFKTPAVIIDNERYVGFEKISRAISAKVSV